MPQLGETVTEGTVTKWMKAVGDTVTRDEPLFEVSTDKVDSEVPSPAAGVLPKTLAPGGDPVEVGVVLAKIGGDSGGEPPGPTETPAPPVQSPAPEATPSRAAVPPAPAPSTPTPARAPAPASQPAPPSPATAEKAPEPLVLSPVVRKLLAENGISAANVTGTGVGGRITREDVLKVVDANHAPGSQPAAPSTPASAPAPAPTPAPASAPTPAPAAVPRLASAPPAPALLGTGDQIVPFSNMRRRTAEHMVRSKSTSPHAFIAYETDFENVERVRKAWGERFKTEEGFSLTYLPFVARAAVEAMRDFPLLNASVVDQSLVVHADINLGIAVDLSNQGLIVPVIHRAEEVTLRGIARRIRDLASRARNRQLNADDIAGGTFSTPNTGPSA